MQEMNRQAAKRMYSKRVLAYFLVGCVLFGSLSALVVSFIAGYQRTQKEYLLESKANAIRDELDLLIARVNTMAFGLMAEDGNPTRFDVLAPQVFKGWDERAENPVHSLALSPGGVVQFVYPYEENKSLIGFDMLAFAAENEVATAMLMAGEMYVTPPIPLEQGGVGINISQPVFLPGQEELWGIVTLVVDPEKLIHSFKLDVLLEQEVHYSLSYTDMEGQQVLLTESGMVEYPMSVDFYTQTIPWTLSITGKMDSMVLFAILVLSIITVVVSLLIANSLVDQQRRRHMTRMLREMANTDHVTGCRNRHYVYEMLVDRESGQWRRDNFDYSLAILDVDMFKQVNDMYGHDVGDDMLQHIAQAALNTVDRSRGDCAIRFGGDEFILLFSGCTLDELRNRLEKMLRDIEAIRLEGRPDVQVTVSVGAVHPSQMGDTPALYKTMLRAADEKLYRAKDAGRNCAHI